MKSGIEKIRAKTGICYVKHEGNYLCIYRDSACQSINSRSKINIPLFYRIALYTSIRRSYKSVLQEFFDELKSEGIIRFKSRESLARACRGCGTWGGSGTAYLLGIFCRYYDKFPRNINVVYAVCAKCKNNDLSACGTKRACGDYYGCGEGVLSPLEPEFNIGNISAMRAEIPSETFINPLG
jgi:hypothetical protein